MEAIVRRVTELVIRELGEGMRQAHAGGPPDGPDNRPNRGCGRDSGRSGIHVERMDMSEYRTPVLTERHVRGLQASTTAVIVPPGTVVSPQARESLRDRNIQLVIE
jgi:hypothetical protein